MRPLKKIATGVAVIAAISLVAACGGSSGGTSAGGSDSASSGMGKSPSADASMDPAANLVGPGCAGYAKQVPDGAGSVAGMAKDPVAVAASNNPILKTLTAAVSGQFNPKVDLVNTLNGGEFTVFAPVDDAFAKLPAKTMADLAKPANADLLTQILTYHVIPGQIAPDKIAGTFKTAQGDTVKVTGSGDSIKVDGKTSVICGGVQTANATVYLIDSVLMPKM